MCSRRCSRSESRSPLRAQDSTTNSTIGPSPFAEERIWPASRCDYERGHSIGACIDLDHADGAVPRAGHADDVLVADPHRAFVAAHLVERGEGARRRRVGVVLQRRHELFGRQLGAGDPHLVPAVVERAVSLLPRLESIGLDGLGDGRRRIDRERARDLLPVDRRGPPHVAPGGERDAEGPSERRRPPAFREGMRRHPALLPGRRPGEAALAAGDVGEPQA
jgi:hypothetical protein